MPPGTKRRDGALRKNMIVLSYPASAPELQRYVGSRQGSQDCGEVEAVVQASQFGATLIVDDPWGRELAARHDLEHYGTL
jgi:predicted nucleic acid-binding protein